MNQAIDGILFINPRSLYGERVRSIVGSVFKRWHYHIRDNVVLFLHFCRNLLEPLLVLLQLDLATFFGDHSFVLLELLQTRNDVHAAHGTI